MERGRAWAIRAAVVGMLVLRITPAAVSAGPGPADGEASKAPAALARGVNLSMWFAQLPPSRERFANLITRDDAVRIRKLGLTFVRVPVDPASLTDERDRGSLDPENLKLFEKALDSFQAEGLAVIVCPYLNDEPKRLLLTDPPSTRAFLSFWAALATRLAARPADKVFLQTMNEPSTDDQRACDLLQEQVVSAIRRCAPRHTIIAASNLRAGGGWNPVAGFVAGAPVRDRNVVYDFHFYDPVQFTHQGATWMTWQVKFYRDLPYPSSPEAVRPHLAGIGNSGARAFADLYGRERWSRDRLQQRIGLAVAWGRKHKVPILCGEFGVYRPNAPDADRLRYLRDVREVLEGHGIGWAMWEYCGDFGLVTIKDGRRVLDRQTARALGLRDQTDRTEDQSARNQEPSAGANEGGPEGRSPSRDVGRDRTAEAGA
ncbi:MAG TPA: cellulase family glycosylhydrolase [Phycisphaerae bacterium]|nr:cellulase family glycosylhydrolase [Phycisphaerae bacterium]